MKGVILLEYSLNNQAMCSMFPVPCDVADKSIKLAKEHQLKVLLLFLRNMQNETFVSDCAKMLSISENDVLDCLDYWCAQGILQKAGQPAKAKTEKPIKIEKKVSVIEKPSKEELNHIKNMLEHSGYKVTIQS